MDYSNFHFPMDSAYPVLNGYYPQTQTPNHHHQPSDFSSASSDFLPNSLYFPRDGSAEVFDDLDDGDAESKTRLSPEQMAELEREFRMNHKPKTERKKVIAQRLRLQLPRVNNWYQNRRAKAKHQRPSQEYDASSNDDTVTSPERGFSNLISSAQVPKSYPFYHRATDSGVDFPQSVDLGLDGFDFGLDPAPEPAEQAQQDVPALGHGHATSLTPQSAVGSDPLWPHDNFSAPVPRPFAKSASVRSASINHSPQSSNGIPAFENGFDQARKASFDPASIHMYHDTLHPPGLSTHELNHTSSDAEFSSLLTPPTETPSMPWMANEIPSRRTSDSSELASTFASNCQVQHPGIGLGVNTSTINSSSVFQGSLESPPVLTPDISPDQSTAKSTGGFDLASRRKAQRPEPLMRPNASRSHSYGGPPTMSPRQKVPSHGIRPSQSSTVLSGRVSKPGSAQASPRTYQTQFEARPQREAKTSACDHSSISAMSGGNFTSFGQPSSATSAHSASSFWQQSTSDGPQIYGNPAAYSSVPDLSANVVQLQPHACFVQQPSNGPRQTQPSDYDAPQSAPSHQSTFILPDSPSIHGEAFTGQQWPVNQYPPPGFNLGVPQIPGGRPGHSQNHSFNGTGYQPPFAPKVHPGFLSGQYNFAAWNQHQMGYGASPPQPERDFKVELETKPDQIFVKSASLEFNFANSTPRDYNSPSGKKR